MIRRLVQVEDDFTRSEASKLENLVLAKWTPQNDLLGRLNNLSNFLVFIETEVFESSFIFGFYKF